MLLCGLNRVCIVFNPNVGRDTISLLLPLEVHKVRDELEVHKEVNHTWFPFAEVIVRSHISLVIRV